MTKAQRLGMLFVLLFVPGVVLTLFFSDLISFESIKANAGALQAQFEANKAAATALFVLLYIFVCAVPTPLVALLTVVSGMLYGFWLGLLIASLSNAVGGTICFLISRTLARQWVKENYGQALSKLQTELERSGFRYACAIRLIMGVPFFVANMGLSLTNLKTTHFFAATIIGMLIPLAIFVNAGQQISQIESLASIMNTGLMVGLLLVGLSPFIFRALEIYLYPKA